MTLAVVHNLPRGGQMRALYYQLKYLSRKHKVDLYSLSCSDNSFLPLKKYVSKSYIFDYFPPPHFPQSVYSIYFNLPDVYKKMAKQINSHYYDAILVHPCFLTQSPYILRYLKAPSIYYCPEPKREFYEHMERKSNFWTYCATLPLRYPIKYIDQTNTRHATRIVTNSVYSKELIKRIYGRDALINYLGVDTDLFRSYSKFSTSEESIRPPSEVSSTQSVLTVGDMSLHKGHDFIIRSLGLISDNLRPKLIIVGKGCIEKKYLAELAESKRVKLELKENISDIELVNIYNKVLVFVYASHKEPFGMVLLEALACGLPVVAVNEGGVGEIVRSGRLGVLVRRNEAEFAREILKRIRLPTRQGQSDIKFRNNWVRMNWGWEKSVGELENYILQII